MASPFPGMDPYLEQPTFWSEFHNRLIVAIADTLIPNLLPNYYIGVETLIHDFKQRYLEIREVGTEAVITILELLSPVNKRNGEGRTTYETKRQKILDSATHLVEIDLIRAHNPMAMAGATTTDYRILISQSAQRPKADLYGFTLQTPIPDVPIPLKPPSEPIPLNLQTILQGVYDRGAYSIRIDYQQPVPAPKLSEPDRTWVQQLLTA